MAGITVDPISLNPVMFLYPWQGPIVFFWFLPTLFLISLLSPLLKNFMNHKISMFIVFTFLLININFGLTEDHGFLNLGGIALYSFYYVLGMFINNYYEYFRKFIKENLSFFTCASIINTVIVFGLILYGKSYFYFDVLALIFFVYCISIWLSKSFLLKISKYSYSIYLYSWFGHMAAMMVYKLSGYDNFMILHLISFFSGFLLPIAIHKAIKKIETNAKVNLGLLQFRAKSV